MKKTILILSSLLTISNAGILFGSGDKSYGLVVGSSTSYGHTYTTIAANVNYFVIDNLSVGASYRAYLGNSDAPSINEITIPVTYHLPIEGSFITPYMGAYYNQTFVEKPYSDYNIFGGRAGVSMRTSPNSYVSVGWVQDITTSDDNVKKQGYPEVSAVFNF